MRKIAQSFLIHEIKILLWLSGLGFVNCLAAQSSHTLQTEVLIIGAGTGGTAAAIQCARLGVPCILTEPSPWLAGMIAAAGVSCTDGNHQLPSGMWQEFRAAIYQHYGGPKKVATGWVSHTNFEPHVSDSIWKAMAAREKLLQVLYQHHFVAAIVQNQRVIGARFTNAANDSISIYAKVCIDATELGDVLAQAGVPFDVGMEANDLAHDEVGITQSNDIIQDLTYVAILKDYGPTADCTIAKPIGYTPEEFDGACTDYYLNTQHKAPTVDAKKMLDYGRLPNGKYMINWPNAGNDTYLNLIPLTASERLLALEKAKQTTLRFIYFIQSQLGFRHLGIAHDEFNTPDRLPWMPYHREGRRMHGLVRMNMQHIAHPFTYGDPLYRTGIAVGDYPIDHHHKKNESAPQHLSFYPIPSYNVPLGALIPKQVKGLIVAEKGISVSNVVNGTTRLQPVVMLTGQAAGVLAARCIMEQKEPAEIPVREVQSILLQHGAMLMPYIDVPPSDQNFAAIQRIGATGILKGKGIPYKWANQTWFYPDSTVATTTLIEGLQPLYAMENVQTGDSLVTARALLPILQACLENKRLTLIQLQTAAEKLHIPIEKVDAPLSKRSIAVLIDDLCNPFQRQPIMHNGHYYKR